MSKKVLITSRSFGKISDEPLKVLEDAGFEVTFKGTDFDQKEFEDIIPEFDALIIGAHPFPEEVMEKCPKLQIICKHGAGLDNIPLEKAKELGVKPMATYVAGALAGCRPDIMGIGPVPATKKVLAKTGWKVEDLDVIEANEAFAAQSVAVGKELGFDVEKQLNPNGGAIALGHPVGASGARILVTLLHEMVAKDAKKGLATLCIGGGMGCATLVERE